MRSPDRYTYLLRTSQVIAIPVEKAFSFFEKPENLSEITPDWLNFRFDNKGGQSETFEGAEFDYTIRWFFIKLKWHTKISEYRRPELFTDVQVKGPYVMWEHLHTFEPVTEGTLMRDELTYRIPFGRIGKIFHLLIIKKQLRDIFSYRDVRFRALLDHLREYRKAVVIPLPVSLFRFCAKELADELTNSQRIVPAKLHDMQFRFVYGNLKEALKDVFS